MSNPATWREIRGRLEARLKAVNAEIAAYPAPIPGCDAQFNYLLERRSGLSGELGRLEEAQASGKPSTADEFLSTCAFLTGCGEEE